MLVSVPWSDSFASHISIAAGSDRDLIAKEIQQGISKAWRYKPNGETLGYVVTRLEGDDTLVCVCYEGTHLKQFADFLCEVCRDYDIPYIRFHTQRPALFKLLEHLEPEPLEYVMRIHTYGKP